ncbi:MAG: hypothetical protein K8U03_02525 [Planctomycetia bacterium]|nr:hypothetical protein [Planctomycetia bacterium]
MSNVIKMLRRLDQDEDGMETMQAVIIFGVAAVVLAVMYKMKDQIFTWVREKLGEMGITVS